jgi:hypothetical protein
VRRSGVVAWAHTVVDVGEAGGAPAVSFSDKVRAAGIVSVVVVFVTTFSGGLAREGRNSAPAARSEPLFLSESSDAFVVECNGSVRLERLDRKHQQNKNYNDKFSAVLASTEQEQEAAGKTVNVSEYLRSTGGSDPGEEGGSCLEKRERIEPK